MTRLKYLLSSKEISIKNLAAVLSISSYQAGQKVANYKLLKYGEILEIMKLLDMTFEEIFQGYEDNKKAI